MSSAAHFVDAAVAHFNLGNDQSAQGRASEAIASYRRAIELWPDYAEAYNNLGNVFQAQGKLEEAAASFRRAIEINPHLAIAHNNLGNAWKHLANISEAIACYRRSLALEPHFAEAHNNLAAAFTDQGRLDEAIDSYEEAIHLRPGGTNFYANLGTALIQMARLDEAIAWLRKALQMNPALTRAHSQLLFAIHFSRDFDAAARYEEHRRWSDQFEASVAKFIRPHAHDRSPTRRLKIGYVSPNFREHCLALFMLPTFSEHDHREFEIYLYSDVARPDEITQRLRATADVWRDTVGLSDDQLAELIRQDQIDIVVDLTMHMDGSRLLVFARKPAPIQATWLAYPGTTGLSTIDYRVTDPHLDPPGLFDPYYSEQSIRLPDTFWCYDPLTTEPLISPLPALANGYITFGCLNNFCKLNTSTLQLWARALSAVPPSRLILLAPEGSCREWVLQIFARENISAGRIHFVALCPRRQYLEHYHQIDIALDTLPYNGHTTSLDAYWMGVPVVTLVGQTVVGRAGLSQLTNLGLPEFIAHTPDQFVQIAADLSTDLPRLSHLRSTLRTRMEQSPLMDAPRFARGIESAYRTMWHRWCVGKPSA
jgi:predicted O-linked N-acetylglucosamine transferase (SPINDLY family)